MVRSVLPPFGVTLEARRNQWLLLGAVVLVLAFVADALFGGHYRIAFDGGDVLRELEALGQWGQLSSLIIVGVVLCRMQPARWRRLLDLGLAAGLVSLVVLLVKFCVGRLRPVHELPFVFDGWLIRIGEAPEALGSYDIASMPSSHTSAAVVLSLFVTLLWPRLAWFAVVMALLVAFSRVIFVAHWAADVVMGALIGIFLGYPIIRGFWGVRLLDALWIRFVDRNAVPALPEVIREERRRLVRSNG
ncbi:MAG: phosphatase PAP2 family protein [Phycisphaerales bacterium]|nr:phosphatase PAP2 family protein [Phycisphaerales bacterium]